MIIHTHSPSKKGESSIIIQHLSRNESDPNELMNILLYSID